MDLKEINNSPLSVWVMVVTTVIVMGCTAWIFWLLRSFENRKVKTTTLQRGKRQIKSGLKLGRLFNSTLDTTSRLNEAVQSKKGRRDVEKGLA